MTLLLLFNNLWLAAFFDWNLNWDLLGNLSNWLFNLNFLNLFFNFNLLNWSFNILLLFNLWFLLLNNNDCLSNFNNNLNDWLNNSFNDWFDINDWWFNNNSFLLNWLFFLNFTFSFNFLYFLFKFMFQSFSNIFLMSIINSYLFSSFLHFWNFFLMNTSISFPIILNLWRSKTNFSWFINLRFNWFLWLLTSAH